MNKQLVVLMMMAGFSAASHAGAGCGKLSEYVVPKTSFSRLPLEAAVGRLTTGTPLAVKATGAEVPNIRVSATDVSGPLSDVLTALGEKSGFQFHQEDCILMVEANTPVAVQERRSWTVRFADEKISRALVRWGDESSPRYQVLWESPKDFPVTAEGSVTGTFQDAIRSIVMSLADTDSPVEAKFHSNNVVRIIRYNGQTADLPGSAQ